MRYCCLESLDREPFVYFQREDKLEKLELVNLSSMRVSNRIIPPSDSLRVRSRQRVPEPVLRSGGPGLGGKQLILELGLWGHTNINSIFMCIFQRIVTCPVDFHWNLPMDFQRHFPMTLHSCDFWRAFFCPYAQSAY